MTTGVLTVWGLVSYLTQISRGISAIIKIVFLTTNSVWCLPTHWSLSFRWGTSLVTNWQVLKDSRLQVSSGLSYTTTILKLDTVNYANQIKFCPSDQFKILHKSYNQNKVSYFYYHSLTFCHNKIPLPPWHHNQQGHRSLLALVYIQSLAGIYIWSEIFLSSQIFSKFKIIYLFLDVALEPGDIRALLIGGVPLSHIDTFLTIADVFIL